MNQPTAPATEQPPKVPALTPEIRAKIEERNKLLEWLENGKATEMQLRRELVNFFIPSPKEGTNTVKGEGFEIKVGHKVSRKLDVPALDSVMPQFPVEHPARVVGNLIEYKPALNLAFYRGLSDEDRKIFDQALTISEDGAPTLEIVLREALPLAFVGANGTPNPPPAPAEGAATSPSVPTTAPARKTKKTAVGSSAKQAAKPAKKAVAKPAKKPAPTKRKK